MPITVTGSQITFNDATTQTTAAIISTSTILSATAGASAGDVGTYMIARRAGVVVSFGSTTAGSGLTPISVMTGITNSYAFGAGGAFTGGAAQSGTWRCMSIASADISGGGSDIITSAALWLRIS